MRQTYFAGTNQVERVWRLVDADGKRLGRLASEIAVVLMGKHRPQYTPHVDTGDFVIVTNAEKIVMTGNKADQMLKYRYSRHPGGIRSRTFGEVRATRPEFLIEDAVKRMLPKGILGRQMLTKLRVFKGGEHPHAAQQPIPLEV